MIFLIWKKNNGLWEELSLDNKRFFILKIDLPKICCLCTIKLKLSLWVQSTGDFSVELPVSCCVQWRNVAILALVLLCNVKKERKLTEKHEISIHVRKMLEVSTFKSISYSFYWLFSDSLEIFHVVPSVKTSKIYWSGKYFFINSTYFFILLFFGFIT